MGLVFGGSFFFMKIALEGVSFGQVAWARIVLGALVLGAIVLVTRPRIGDGPVLPREPIVWLHFLVIGVTGSVIPFLLFAWAEQYIASSLASIYNATGPITTALMATLVVRVERLSLGRWIGVGIGITGVILIIGPWQAALSGNLAGQLACLGATLSYGFMLPYARRFLTRRPIAPTTFAFLNVGSAAFVMLLLTPIVAWSPVDLQLPIVLSLLALGAFGTGLANIWNINVLRAWGPTNTATLTYITPVVGVILGVAFLQETLSWHEPIGALVVFLGILLTQGRLRLPRRIDRMPSTAPMLNRRPSTSDRPML